MPQRQMESETKKEATAKGWKIRTAIDGERWSVEESSLKKIFEITSLMLVWSLRLKRVRKKEMMRKRRGSHTTNRHHPNKIKHKYKKNKEVCVVESSTIESPVEIERLNVKLLWLLVERSVEVDEVRGRARRQVE